MDPFLGDSGMEVWNLKAAVWLFNNTVSCGMQQTQTDNTLPSALGWKRTFGSRGQPRSPAHGGKEALTESEAVPLFRPHRTSHLGEG